MEVEEREVGVEDDLVIGSVVGWERTREAGRGRDVEVETGWWR